MSEWNLVYDSWSPDQQPLREALCTLGNGYFAVRGAAEEARPGDVHYPGVYIAGAYNRAQTEVAGRIVENEDLVNWPNWLRIAFRHEDRDWFDLSRVTIIDFWQDLDLRRGALDRRVRFRDEEGRTSTLRTRRFVHMRRPHLAAVDWSLLPEDWDGTVEIRSEIDGNVINAGVQRYRDLKGEHIDVLETSHDAEDRVSLVARSRQSLLRVAVAARSRLHAGADETSIERRAVTEPARSAHEFIVQARRGERIRLEKIVSLFTGRDHAVSEPALEARAAVERAGDFDELLHSHERAWSRLWRDCDIEIEGHERVQQILRLHIFHLLQTASYNTTDLDVGVPARGWHGEAYRGHIFWDELFIFPYLTLRVPELTRSLLMYRYRRLDAARRNAQQAGYAGAMFPWQSGSNGREESQTLHLNPRSGRWVPDETHLQRHINAAIVYNVWGYYAATGDEEFLSFYGAEIIVEVARFWASVATFDEQRGRYDITGVVGPDEYHTSYPDSDEPGLRNNAYTNIMAAWCLCIARECLTILPQDRADQLRAEFGVTDDELKKWDHVSRRLHIPFHEGVISQFEGYEKLEEFDWEGYRKKYADIQRLDRILEAEDDSPNRYKASKQADVLMLLYLFSSDALGQLLEHLGYDFDPDVIPRTVKYYHDRTSHGSTLSRVVHAWVLARSDRERSWSCFEDALRSDVEDIQGGTTSEGIHLGAMAGAVDIVQRCYTGIEFCDGALCLNPRLPEELREVKARIRFRGHALALRVAHDEAEVSSYRDGAGGIAVRFPSEIIELNPGETKRVRLK